MKNNKAISKRGIGNNKLVLVLTLISTLLLIMFLLVFKFRWLFSNPVTSEGWENRYFSNEQLKEYNGINPKKPIYTEPKPAGT